MTRIEIAEVSRYQLGIVVISADGFEVQIPYHLVVGLTFDQQKIDTP
jgi:fibronectin type 3 domain-containing protein